MAAAEFVRACARPEDLIDDGTPEVAFVGRSNVGKSSLLNRLAGSAIARTSSTPGRTRTVNWFRIADRWWLVDLPGFGYARASKSDREILPYLAGIRFPVHCEVNGPSYSRITGRPVLLASLVSTEIIHVHSRWLGDHLEPTSL